MMREIVWSLVGVALGLRAALKARGRIAALRRDDEVFGEAHVADLPVTVPLIGLVGAVLLAGIARRFDGDLTVLVHIVLVGASLHLALVDVDTHVLPRRTSYGAFFMGAPLLVFASLVDHEGSLVWTFLGALIMWMALMILGVLSRGDLGGGDVAMGLMLGAYLGFDTPWDIAYALSVCFVAGGVFALGLLLFGRADKRTRFAFGPFLILGTLVMVVR